MSETSMNETGEMPVEAILREELAHSDAVLGTIAPILGHLAVSSENSLFNDEIVAQIRGMANCVARELLNAQMSATAEDTRDTVLDGLDGLSAELLAHEGFLSHCHALGLESALAKQLLQRSGIDPVLPPMMQALISSSEADVSSNAMAALTSQARFLKQMDRMELVATELPGDLFHEVIQLWRSHAGPDAELVTSQAEVQIRAKFDESASRLGLFSRLVNGMGKGAQAGLSISHAGVATFLSVLAQLSKQPRNVAAISTNERLVGRLALGLRAAGLKPKEVEEQFLLIHPSVELPDGFDMLRSDRAAALLSETGEVAG